MNQPTRRLSPAAAWAFALGASMGWGSLIFTGNTWLAQAGPAGSLFGLLLGAAVMLVISRNYAYLMNAFPESGGAYTYARELFGHDQSFLVSWFLSLVYFAVLWANATALPVFAEYFLGDVFRFGKLYTVFGYDVYLGGVLLSAAAILLVSFLCARFRRFAAGCMIALVSLFSAGIAVCFIAALLGKTVSFSPAMIPDRPVLSQIVRIACISPWAFIGFESISHSVEDFSFRRAKVFRILVAAVLSATLLYLCITLLSVAAYPPRYASWLEYIRDLDNLSGIESLPAFYAANHYLGDAGVTILALSLLALVLTSLVGTVTALSRLFCAMGKDGVLPARFGELNRSGAPGRSIALIAGISMLIPLLGRVAIGWIVDVTSLGTALVYAFVSASALRLARKRTDRPECWTGAAGLAAMVVVCTVVLFSNLFTTDSMAPESFILFVVWAILGFICFRFVLHTDQRNRFGQSVVVWIALLSLVLFVSLVWMSQSIMSAADQGLSAVEEVYIGSGQAQAQPGLIARQLDLVRQSGIRSMIVVILIFALSLWILIKNFNLMSRHAKESETQLGIARAKANTDPLTGVKSKHAYTDKEAQLDEQIGSGTAEPFAIAVCDLNGLKQANDTYGHKAGDELIRNACRMICRLFAHSPVYRIGGDEFAVFLSGEDYERRGELMAELHRLSVDHITSGGPIVSGGLADFMPSDQHTASVFDRADVQMYAEKRVLKSLGAPARKLSPDH